MTFPIHLQRTLNCRGRLLNLQRPTVMGILNLTPDSFSDGGKFNEFNQALLQAEQMLEEGAVILDLGGYSSRPGAQHISIEQEISRVADIGSAIMDRFPQALLSIDTFRAPVAKEMLDRGVHLVNDISAGTMDPEMLPMVAAFDAPFIMMHMQGKPQTMQQKPQYHKVAEEVWDHLNQRIKAARAAGITDLIVDPGFGFGKTIPHNYELFRNLNKFKLFGLPLMVGISRKSMLYKLFETSPDDVLELATALHFKALEFGANILRVHDVKAAVRAIKLHHYFEHGTL